MLKTCLKRHRVPRTPRQPPPAVRAGTRCPYGRARRVAAGRNSGPGCGDGLILIAGILCCLSLLLPSLAHAQGISIDSATSKERNAVYMVNIGLELQMSDEIREALRRGVSLEIDVHMEVRLKRKWLWDKLVKEVTLHYKLQHHPLSDVYLVTNLDNNSREQFQTLNEALDYLGAIRNYPLIGEDELEKDRKYQGWIMAELNIQELPPPLQTATYVSSRLHQESKWYEWALR